MILLPEMKNNLDKIRPENKKSFNKKNERNFHKTRRKIISHFINLKRTRDEQKKISIIKLIYIFLCYLNFLDTQE
jgi:predicted nucleotide-binding protein (sugar kinase/HSP70/actin superfamily)